MSEPLLNRWAYCAELTLPAHGAGGVAINLGIAYRPPGLLLRARVSCEDVLAAAHRLSLFEGRAISNTIDPERGVHRARRFGDMLPDWLSLRLSMASEDVYVFHAPGTFVDGGNGPNGETLFSGLGTGPAPAKTGPWVLTPNPAGRYYMVHVQNLEPTPVTFGLTLDYRFVTP